MTGFSVKAEGLKKSFRTGDRLSEPVRDVSFEVPEGRVTAVIGESGCGKTTLLRMIAGLEKPDSGKIVFPGEKEAGRPPRISLVFQEPRLFPWLTVSENVALAVRGLPERERRGKVLGVLSLVKLSDAADAYPAELSGGMAQRAGLARALVSEPDILLLDEAFSALDALTRNTLYREFASILESKRMTTVLVTHDVTEAVLLSSSVIELSEGVIAHTFPVPFPYPRTLSTPGAAKLADEIFQTFFN